MLDYNSLFPKVMCLYLLLCAGAESRPRYRCPDKTFVRLANSCYHLSSEIATWQEAHFRCRDMNSQLAVLATEHEDETLRNYMEQRDLAPLGRWIGGMWMYNHWIWAAQGMRVENRRSFASAAAQELDVDDRWMCLYMDARNRYRWSNENCVRQLHYVCEAPLVKYKISRQRTRTTTTVNPNMDA